VLYDLLAEHLTVDSPNRVAKATCVVGGMLAGADSIDDLDVLRRGPMRRLFGGVRAPSTLGTCLRSFTHGHVQQLDAVSSRLLAGLAPRAPGLLAGAGPEGIAFLDVDDSIGEVHGHAKQAAAYGYTGVRGLNFQIATLSTPLVAPVVAAARLRRGNTASHKGSGRLLTQAITTSRRAGVTHADQPRDPGPGQLHDQRRDTLPDADAVATEPANRRREASARGDEVLPHRTLRPPWTADHQPSRCGLANHNHPLRDNPELVGAVDSVGAGRQVS